MVRFIIEHVRKKPGWKTAFNVVSFKITPPPLTQKMSINFSDFVSFQLMLVWHMFRLSKFQLSDDTVWLSFLSNAKAEKFIFLPTANNTTKPSYSSSGEFYNKQLNKGVPVGACLMHRVVYWGYLRQGLLFTYLRRRRRLSCHSCPSWGKTSAARKDIHSDNECDI